MSIYTNDNVNDSFRKESENIGGQTLRNTNKMSEYVLKVF